MLDSGSSGTLRDLIAWSSPHVGPPSPGIRLLLSPLFTFNLNSLIYRNLWIFSPFLLPTSPPLVSIPCYALGIVDYVKSQAPTNMEDMY